MIFTIAGTGAAQELLANALRNSQIARGKGASLIRTDSAADLRLAQLEKAHVGPIEAGRDRTWKPDAMLIVLGDETGAAMVELEAAAPGVTEQLGPVIPVTVGGEG